MSSEYIPFLGWLATLMLLWSGEARRVMTVPVVLVLGLTFFMQAAVFSRWHLLPLYPFLTLALAAWIASAWRAAGWPQMFAVVLLLVPYALHQLGLVVPGAIQALRYAYAGLVGATLIVITWSSAAPEHAHRMRMLTRTTIAGATGIALVAEVL
jgi:hypothetical protein